MHLKKHLAGLLKKENQLYVSMIIYLPLQTQFEGWYMGIWTVSESVWEVIFVCLFTLGSFRCPVSVHLSICHGICDSLLCQVTHVFLATLFLRDCNKT